MKKLLLGCLLAFGIGANAQYNHTEDFSDLSSANTSFGFFGSGAAASTTVYCSGTQAFTETYNATNTAGGPFTDFSKLSQKSNGQKTTVSINYRKASSIAGTLYLIIAKYDAANNIWNLSVITSKTLTTTAVNTCASLTGTIAAGVLDPAQDYGIGAYFSRTSGSGAVYFDDLVVAQDVVTTPPSCTTITSPANGSTTPYGNTTISWAAASGAVSYDLAVGTSSGSADVFKGTVTGGALSQSISTNPNTQYFATVTPSNLVGSASGCPEISFTTNNTLQYCTSVSGSSNYEYITNVNFGSINNTSVKAATVGYTDYNNQSTSVAQGATNLPISVTIAADSGDYLSAFFDWNHDGNFSADEAVVLATSTSTSGAVTGNVSVPINAVIGSTKMRVVIKFNGAPNGCDGNYSYGETEDYTVNVTGPVLGTMEKGKNALSVFPNPFHDVLNISDVKNVKSVTINDISGRQVTNMDAKAQLKLGGLKDGLYLINLKMKDGSVKSFKAIKK